MCQKCCGSAQLVDKDLSEGWHTTPSTSLFLFSVLLAHLSKIFGRPHMTLSLFTKVLAKGKEASSSFVSGVRAL